MLVSAIVVRVYHRIESVRKLHRTLSNRVLKSLVVLKPKNQERPIETWKTLFEISALSRKTKQLYTIARVILLGHRWHV